MRPPADRSSSGRPLRTPSSAAGLHAPAKRARRLREPELIAMGFESGRNQAHLWSGAGDRACLRRPALEPAYPRPRAAKGSHTLPPTPPIFPVNPLNSPTETGLRRVWGEIE